MAYESAAQFDRAVKKAIRESGKDPGIAYRAMLRDRFLCRIFSNPEQRFILKGGGNLLARIPDARATRDIDFATSQKETSKSALQALNELSRIDLGDFCTFKLTDVKESMDDNGYSRLLKLRYASFVGDEEKDPILIDLSLDCTITQPADIITPANRIDINGVPAYDYFTYSIVDQLADKFCAIMEIQPGGWPSSRMKDLVDVVTYAMHEELDITKMRFAIKSECNKRDMPLPKRFEAPFFWEARFEDYAKKNGVPAEFATLESASKIAAKLFDPVLSNTTLLDKKWDFKTLCWVSTQ